MVTKFFKNKILHKNTKNKLKLARPILMCSRDNAPDYKKRGTESGKMLGIRLIMGPVRVGEYEFRKGTNQAIQQEINEDTIKN